MIDAYLIDTVILRTSTKDKWGTVSETFDTSTPSYVEKRVQRIRNRTGAEVVSMGVVTMKAEPDLNTLVVIDGVEKEILDVSQHRVFGQESYFKVFHA